MPETPDLDVADAALALRFESAVEAVLDEVKGHLVAAAVTTLKKGKPIEAAPSDSLAEVLSTLHGIATKATLGRPDAIRLIGIIAAMTATLDIENATPDA